MSKPPSPQPQPDALDDPAEDAPDALPPEGLEAAFAPQPQALMDHKPSSV